MTPSRPGYPFDPSGAPEDPVDPRTDPGVPERVRTQVEALLTRCTDPTTSQSLAEQLIARHEGQGEALRLQMLPGGNGPGSLVAAGQVVVAPENWRQWRTDRGSLPAGFTVIEPGETPGDGPGTARSVVGLRLPDGVPLPEGIARLREAGLQAWVNPVAMAACPVGKKGDAGPVPVRPRRSLRPAHRPLHGRPVPTPRDVFIEHRSPVGPLPLAVPPVGIVDTGITDQTREDGWLAGIPRTRGVVDPLDALPRGGDGLLDLGAGHGTFVAGIIEQIDPQIAVTDGLRVHRALDSDGVGTEESVCRSMIQAVQDGQQILCLSFGEFTADDAPPRTMAATIEEIGRLAARHHREILLVAAAGNSGDERPCWPAAFSRGAQAFLQEEDPGPVKVVAVAGLTTGREPAPWATRGPWVDLSTAAEGICSVYVEGTEYPSPQNPHPDTYGADPWALWSGSSFAAPQVVGALTRLCRERELSPHAALRLLLESGLPLEGFGRAVHLLPGH
ncbi:MAG: hypothetical protein QG608_574 [Actinomycetota bacterium]|nr:hypothetical protein [Actinomycetota bacterium]